MRRKIALSAVAVAVAASFAPLTSASAVCAKSWEIVFGQCEPCETARPAYDNLNRRLGYPLSPLNCVVR